MRALLERNLRDADLSFPAWTVLVLTHPSLLSPEQIAQRQIGGHIVASADETRQAIGELVTAGLARASENGMLAHTEKGAVLFEELSGSISEITRALYGDLPGADLEATHRTLVEIARRANGLLSSSRP